MNMLKKVFSTFLLSLSLIFVSTSGVTSGFAQNYIDLLRIDYSVGTGNDFETGPGTSDVKEWVIDATIPIVLSEHSVFLTGFLFENVSVTPYAGQGELSVYTLNLKLGINRVYSDTWSATYFILPKLSSDMKKLSRKNSQIGLVSLFKYSKGTSLNYKFGIYFNTELFGPFIVPLTGIYYQSMRWETNILIPTTVDISYRVVNSLKVGLRFNGFIKSFNLNDSFNGLQQYLSKSNNEIGGYIGWVQGRVNLLAMVGHSMGRSYRTYEQGDRLGLAISAIKLGDDRTPLNTDFNNGLVFKISILYRFELDNK